MKKGVMLLFILSTIFLIGLVTAATDIKITSVANDSVTLNVINPDTSDAYQSYLNYTGSDGSFTFSYDGAQAKIALTIIVRREGSIVYNRYYGNYSTGGNINIDMNIDPDAKPAPKPVIAPVTAEVINTTPNTTENITTNITKNNPTNTNSSRNSSGILATIDWKIIGYVIGGILIILLIIWGIRYYRSHRDDIPIHEKAMKLLPKKSPEYVDKDLAATERKLKQATLELEAIKNRQVKVKEAERKFEEAKRDLERAKKGY